MCERLVADRDIDITGEICPMTFVRTRLALDGLRPGQILAVRLRGKEPMRSVPATARLQGHAVLQERLEPDGALRVVIKKSEAPHV